MKTKLEDRNKIYKIRKKQNIELEETQQTNQSYEKNTTKYTRSMREKKNLKLTKCMKLKGRNLIEKRA